MSLTGTMYDSMSVLCFRHSTALLLVTTWTYTLVDRVFINCLTAVGV